MTLVEPVKPKSTRLQGWTQTEREGERERDRGRGRGCRERENKDLILRDQKLETKERKGRWVKIGTC